MNYRLHTLSGEEHTQLALAEFSVGEPKGVVQIIHGALEYKERYFEFAHYLQQAGYAVILSDNRGHGKSISKQDSFGLMRDFDSLVADQVSISQWIQKRYPNRPLILFGHSFGSILARVYLQKNDQFLSKLILTGTANYVTVVPVGIQLAKAFIKVRGELAYSPVLNYLSGNLGVEQEWLSNNPENNRKAKEDKKMVPRYPVRSLLTIWEGDRQLKAYDRYQCQNPDLPILNVVGAEDKITGGSRGVADTLKTLKKIGYHKLTNVVMEHMKHEVLNEVDNQLVYEEILRFLEDSRKK
ncbi:alpha/beta fold hydrolase [Enterococcus sp. 2201sp1_2201st1_B8_2201SCRN_220225]|uniref:alpha/beta fold hydrolase n=1 Tax=unclassified Enterococcus TaxID=2608891 RepID=UPI0034A31468